MTTKQLTTEQATQMIEQLEAIADTLFSVGETFLGNSVQEVVYCMEANLETA